jgi:hypothetical protein
MKTRKNRPITSGVTGASQRRAQQEIEDFLRALSSYPDRVALNPYLSFEEHLFSVVAANQTSAVAADRRRSCGR